MKIAKRWKIILAASLAAVLLVSGVGMFVAAQADDNVVARVNGDFITAEDMGIFFEVNRSSVLHAYRTDADAADFWHRETDGRTPAQALGQAALEQAIDCKLLLILAKDLGLMADTSFSAVWELREQENTSRRQRYENGDVVYGVVEFDKNTFLSYYFSNLRLDLTAQMAERYFDITEEAVRAYYGNIGEFEELPVIYETETLKLPAGSPDTAPADAVWRLIQSGRSFSQALEELGTEGEIAAETYTSDTNINELARNQALYSALQSMEIGEVSEPLLMGDGEYLIVRLTDRYEQLGKSYEDINTRIRANLEREEMDRFMAAYRETADIRVDEGNLSGALTEALQ